MNKPRIIIAALSLSAAGMLAIWDREGWTDTAVIPVKGDVPTVGPGLTKRPDGSPVRMGDTVKPLEGAKRSLAHIQADEAGLKKCVTAPLSQEEYDLLVSHAYQYGAKRTCSSRIVKLTNAQQYGGACEAHLDWRFAGGYDCSTLVDGKPNRRCWGVWADSKKRRDRCVAAQ